jgi:hypothetical protein
MQLEHFIHFVIDKEQFIRYNVDIEQIIQGGISAMKHKATSLGPTCSQGHRADPPDSSKRWHYSSRMRWLPSNCNRHA